MFQVIEYKSNRKNVDKAITSSIEKGLLAVGLFIQGRASLLCPVDTGRLRASITYAVGNVIGNIGIKAKPEDKPNGKTASGEVQIGTNVEYALKIEKGKRGKPFLTPAIEQNKKKIEQILGLELMKLDK